MIINVIIAANLLLLKDFIGFNDSQQNVLRVKQAMRLLVKNISRYYKRRDDDNKNEPNQPQTINGEDQPQVLIPFDVYSTKVLENIDILIRDSNKFRSNQIKKIANNIDVIHKMIYEDKKEIEYVAKWIRIPIKIFIKCLSKYYKWIDNRSK